MKRVIFYTIFLLFTLIPPASSEEKSLSPELLEEVESKAIRPYFNALMHGNMELVMHYTTGKKHGKIQRLLDRDKEYPKFLREFYKGAVFSVKHGVFTEDGVIIDVNVDFPRGEILTYRLILQREERNGGAQAAGVGRWQITEEPNYQAE